MTELLEVKNTMSSLEIAELTGKRHDAITASSNYKYKPV